MTSLRVVISIVSFDAAPRGASVDTEGRIVVVEQEGPVDAAVFPRGFVGDAALRRIGAVVGALVL